MLIILSTYSASNSENNNESPFRYIYLKKKKNWHLILISVVFQFIERQIVKTRHTTCNTYVESQYTNTTCKTQLLFLK